MGNEGEAKRQESLQKHSAVAVTPYSCEVFLGWGKGKETGRGCLQRHLLSCRCPSCGCRPFSQGVLVQSVGSAPRSNISMHLENHTPRPHGPLPIPKLAGNQHRHSFSLPTGWLGSRILRGWWQRGTLTSTEHLAAAGTGPAAWHRLGAGN